MSREYPIGSPEDYILNALPKIVAEWMRFLDLTQSYLRDWQLDLQVIATGTGDATEMAEDLQTKMQELQVEIVSALRVTEILQRSVDEIGEQLRRKLDTI